MSASTVSATIQDPSGQTFNNGTWQLIFKPTPNTPGIFTDSTLGSTFTKIFGGSLDGTGSFSQANVARNDTISPAGSRWTLIVTPNANDSAYQVDLNVNSPAFSATAVINAIITNILINATPVARAYKDSEIIPVPNGGSLYYDQVLKQLKVFDTASGVFISTGVAVFSIPISPVGDVMANLITAMQNAPSGAEFVLPPGIFTCPASSYTIPNDGTALPQQASFRVVGASSDPGSTITTAIGKIPTSGTILKFTGGAPGSGGRINCLGEGQLEITGVTFQETVGCPTLFVTNTILKAHDNYFYGEKFAWISAGVATRIQTTGGASTAKYSISLGAGTNGVNYRYFVYIKNQGATAVSVSNGQGDLLTVPAGTIAEFQFMRVSNGSVITMTFSTANSGDAMDIIAQYPNVSGHGGYDANLISGASSTFAGSWAAQGGAVPTLTQNQTINQRPITDAIILGGNNATGGGGLTDAFAGYLTTIKDNFFNRIRTGIQFTLFANKIQVTGNHFWIECGSDLQGAIDFSGACNGSDISFNNIESFNYKFPIWGHGANAIGHTFVNNSFYDIQSGLFQSGYSFEAGSAGNVVISSNGEALASLSQLITDGTAGQTVLLSSIAPPGMVRIADVILGGPATNITFSSIPANFKHLRIELQGRSDAVATASTLLMQFNADAGANYDSQWVVGNNGLAIATNTNAGGTTTVVGIIPAASVTRAAIAAALSIMIPNYASTTFEKSHHAEGGFADSTVGNDTNTYASGSWRNTAAITSVKIFPAGGSNLVTGTRATLYALT